MNGESFQEEGGSHLDGAIANRLNDDIVNQVLHLHVMQSSGKAI